MIKPEVFYLVVGMGIVTYVPRWLPVFFLSRRELPPWFVQWLELIPVAILSALVSVELFVTPAPRSVEFLNARTLAAVPTLLFALKTRSLGGTVIVGMLLFWLLEQYLY